MKEKLALDGINLKADDQHFRCMDHVFNLGVQAMLKSINKIYEKTSEGQKYLDFQEQGDDHDDGVDNVEETDDEDEHYDEDEEDELED